MTTSTAQEKISIAECRKHLGEMDLSDEQVVKLRDALYYLSESTIETLLEG